MTSGHRADSTEKQNAKTNLMNERMSEKNYLRQREREREREREMKIGKTSLALTRESNMKSKVDSLVVCETVS